MPEEAATWRAKQGSHRRSQHWIEAARNGISAIWRGLGSRRGDKVAYDFAGAAGIEKHCVSGLKAVTADLELIQQARQLGARNLNLDASCHEWHFTGTPMCWDFLIWLVDAEMTRRRHNAPAPLRIHFSRVEHLDPYGRDFFESVFRPLLPLIGAIEDRDAAGGRHKPVYVPQDIVLASKAWEAVPILQASAGRPLQHGLWLHGTRPITITLREATLGQAQ
jgi:hypothetical protein